jgi:hypothetical protein
LPKAKLNPLNLANVPTASAIRYVVSEKSSQLSRQTSLLQNRCLSEQPDCSISSALVSPVTARFYLQALQRP